MQQCSTSMLLLHILARVSHITAKVVVITTVSEPLATGQCFDDDQKDGEKQSIVLSHVVDKKAGCNKERIPQLFIAGTVLSLNTNGWIQNLVRAVRPEIDASKLWKPLSERVANKFTRAPKYSVVNTIAD